MGKHKKITFVTSTDENTGSTRLRVYAIAKELSKRGYKIAINKNLFTADILVFQKSNYKYLRERFNKYLFTNKFIIFDIDDMYLGKYIKLAKNADMVIAGNQYLADFYKKYNPVSLPLDDVIDVLNIKIEQKKNLNLKNPKIGWFGNLLNLPILEKLQIKDVTTITQGGDIEWSRETIDENLKKFDLILIPQDKTPEGLSKCNNRMLKALFLGVPVLVSDMPVYVELSKQLNYPAEFIVKDGEDWNEKINKIKSGEIEFDYDFAKARQKILSEYSIDAITDKWISLVNEHYKKYNFLSHMIKLIQISDIEQPEYAETLAHVERESNPPIGL